MGLSQGKQLYQNFNRSILCWKCIARCSLICRMTWSSCVYERVCPCVCSRMDVCTNDAYIWNQYDNMTEWQQQFHPGCQKRSIKYQPNMSHKSRNFSECNWNLLTLIIQTQWKNRISYVLCLTHTRIDKTFRFVLWILLLKCKLCSNCCFAQFFVSKFMFIW